MFEYPLYILLMLWILFSVIVIKGLQSISWTYLNTLWIIYHKPYMLQPFVSLSSQGFWRLFHHVKFLLMALGVRSTRQAPLVKHSTRATWLNQTWKQSEIFSNWIFIEHNFQRKLKSHYVVLHPKSKRKYFKIALI